MHRADPLPSPRRHRGRLLPVGLLLLAIAACQAQSPPVAMPPPAAAADAGALLDRIEAAIGDARCERDDQCRTLPIGQKACGGPERWLAWSIVNGSAEQLSAWASELAALQRRRNQSGGIVSNCQYNADPGAMCRAGHCVLRPAGAVQ